MRQPRPALSVSVSADGSTWFLGRAERSEVAGNRPQFQYPLMDRLGFWGNLTLNY